MSVKSDFFVIACSFITIFHNDKALLYMKNSVK